jgi:hypothetical protein
MEAVFSFEMLVCTHKSTRRYNAEHRTPIYLSSWEFQISNIMVVVVVVVVVHLVFRRHRMEDNIKMDRK